MQEISVSSKSSTTKINASSPIKIRLFLSFSSFPSFLTEASRQKPFSIKKNNQGVSLAATALGVDILPPELCKLLACLNRQA